MIAYKYDNITKEYIGTQNCQLDPLSTQEQGKNIYLLPADCTFKIPPEKSQNKAIIFENNEWIQVNDFRGKRAYNDKGLFIIDYIGDLKNNDKLLTQEQIEGLNNGTLIWKDGQIMPKPEPTTEEKLIQKENEYSMSRWQHEYIVANPESFPEFVLNRAQELEDLAEELRRENENNQEDSGESL